MESKKEIYDLIPTEYYPKTILIQSSEALNVIISKIKTENILFIIIQLISSANNSFPNKLI